MKGEEIFLNSLFYNPTLEFFNIKLVLIKMLLLFRNAYQFNNVKDRIIFNSKHDSYHIY